MRIKSILDTFMHSSSFRKYFFSIFSVLVCIIILLGITLSTYSSRAFRNSIAETNAKMLNQMVMAQEFVLDEINKSFLNVVTNQEIQSFSKYYRENDINSVRNVMSILDGHLMSNEYIDAISVYICDQRLVLSTVQGVVDIDEYYDREFIANINDFPEQKAVLRKSTNGLDSNSFILSFVQKIPFGNSVPEIIIIFDTNDNYIKASTMRENAAQKIITNEQNVVMYSENNAVNVNDEFCPEGREQNSLYFSAKVGGEDLMFTYQEMDRYKWNYYISIPFSDVYKSNSTIIVIELALCLLMMFVSLYLSYAISVKIYMPIKSISDLISSADDDEDNEIQMIKNNVVSLIDNNQNLSQTLENYLIQQKEMFLKAIIDGEADDYAAVSSLLSRYGLSFGENDSYIAFCVSINDYKNFAERYSEKQYNLFSLYINDILNEFVAATGRGFVLNMGLTQMIIVLSAGQSYSERMKYGLYDVAEKLAALLSADVQQKFSIGVSTVHKDFANIHCCVDEARSSIETRMVNENTSILLYENISKGEVGGFEYPFAIEKKILTCIKTGSRELLSELLEEFAEYLKTNITNDILLIRNAFMQLLFVSVHNILEMDRSINFGNVVTEAMTGILSSKERISDFCDCMMEFYDYIFDILEQKQNSKNQGFIDEIKDYIIKNIGTELTVEQISKHFFVSESHLRRIFKDCTQTGIKKFIDEQRMERAKTMLLENPDMKIADIAAEIGYLSVQAFTNAFKANTNMTPKEYRKQQ